jgi:hypothetical protein
MHIEEIRSGLSARLQARREEIGQAALTRIYAVGDPSLARDPEYAEGLHAAVSAALDYGLAVIEGGEERAPAVPAVLLTQARLAARNSVSLDTVLRRYLAGFTLLGDFLIEEAEASDALKGPTLKRLLRAQSALFDRLIAAVTEEYMRESDGRQGTAEQRRAEQVRRLLDGDLLNTSELEYEFDAHHLGAIATGAGAAGAIRDLAGGLDCSLLRVCPAEGTVWAWLGGRRPLDPEQLTNLVPSGSVGPSLAIGEPGKGLAGWRLTHRQARAALPIARRSRCSPVRYADVALLASILQDELLVTSLCLLYLEPLAEDRDGGAVLRETLRAYFVADHNVSSAAAALGVNRHTVTNRLHAIEERLGRPLSSCTAEMDAALRLEDLGYPAMSQTTSSGLSDPSPSVDGIPPDKLVGIPN